MRPRLSPVARLASVLVASAIVACTSFKNDASGSDAGSGGDGGGASDTGVADVDASGPADGAPASDTGSPGVDSGSGLDAGMDAPADAADESLPEASGDGSDGGPVLDPLLVLPAGGSSCDPTQGDLGCNTGFTCRIASPTSGQCDDFTPNAIAGFPCTLDSDCDDTLQCYNGKCHVLCVLGNTCAGGCACFPVGNVSEGLCCPGL